MIEYKKCKKQYIGETKRTLRERFSQRRQATNNPLHANAAATVPSYFNPPGHSITDMGLIPLELQPTPSASRRKAREAYLIHRGQTTSPDGINQRNDTFSCGKIVNFIRISTTIIVIKYKTERNKNEKTDKKRTRIGHMTERKRRQNLAMCCSLYFQSCGS